MTRDESWDDLDREGRRARRREFRKRKERKLDSYAERLDGLDLDEEQDAELFEEVRGVRRSKRELRGRLRDLYDASDHEWDGVREEFDESWGEFESDWEDLSKLVSGRIDTSEDEG